MLRLALVIITAIAIIIASYTDFRDRKREIPNWLTWGLVAVGILGHLIISAAEWSIKPVLFSLCAAAIFFALANITFYAGLWGGGDAKLLIGIAATIPIYPALLKNYFAPALAPWPFLLSLTINILMLGAIYGFLYMLLKVAFNYKKFAKEFLALAKILKLKYFLLALLLTPIPALINRKLAFLAILIAFIPAVPILFTFSKAVDKIMVYKQSVSELVPGDRPIKNIMARGRKLYEHRTIGFTDDDIARIKSVCGTHAKIPLRDGIPYAPSFLIGLLFTLIAGDIIIVLANALV